MKFFQVILNSLFIALMVGVAALFLIPLLPLQHNLELRIVESGSMEPSIMTGSLVVILPKSTYQAGDVITFKNTASDVPTTHRIVDSYTADGQTFFVTKGDANEEADTQPVVDTDVIGIVQIAVPRVGYLLDFARTPLGFIFLIALPAALLILGEVEKIWQEMRRRPDRLVKTAGVSVINSVVIHSKSKTARFRSMMDIATPVYSRTVPTLDLRTIRPRLVYSRGHQPAFAGVSAALTLTLCVAIVGSSFFGSTVSYFNDFEHSLANSLATVELDFAVAADDTLFNFENGTLANDDDGAVVTTITLTPESVVPRYDVATEYVSGNQLLCDAIMAENSIPFAYQGSLSALAATNISFTAPWSLMLTLPNDTNVQVGDTCLIDFIFIARHFEEAFNQGYVDEERVSLSFTLSDALVNSEQTSSRELPVSSFTLLPAVVGSSTASTSPEISEAADEEEFVDETDDTEPIEPPATETEMLEELVSPEAEEIVEEIVAEEEQEEVTE